MSNIGQGVLAVAGGVIGFLAGGPTGALYGFQLGLLAGSIISPTQGPTITRPRLGDIGVTGSAVGSSIAWGVGVWPATGQFIWQSDLREIITSEDVSAKGAPSQTVETPTYYQDFAIGLDDTEGKDFGGVRRIWFNGKIVYDRRPLQAGESTDAFNARMAISESLDQIMTVYLGTEDQMPDPTMQMRMLAKGDEPSAFRGLAYLVFANWQNKAEDGNRMPQSVKVECYTSATSANPDNREYSASVLYDWKQGGMPIDWRNRNHVYGFGHFGNDAITFFFNDVDPPGGPYCTQAFFESEMARLCGLLNWPVLYVTQTSFLSNKPGTGYPDISGGPVADNDTFRINLYYGPFTPTANDYYVTSGSFVPDQFSPGRVGYSLSYGFFEVLDISADINVPNPMPPFGPLFGNGQASLVARGENWWFQATDPIYVQVDRFPGPPDDPALAGLVVAGLLNFFADKTTGAIRKGGPWVDDALGNYYYLQNFYARAPFYGGQVTLYPLNPAIPIDDPRHTEAFWTAAYNEAVAKGTMGPGKTYDAFGTGDADSTYPHLVTGGYYRDVDHTTIDTEEVSQGYVARLICRSAGYADADINTEQIDAQMMIGYMRNAVMPGRGALDPLHSLGFFDVIESDGQIKCVKRGNATVRRLEEDQLGAFIDGDQPPAAIAGTKALDLDLPVQVRVHYLSPSRDLEADEQLSLPRVNTDAVGVADVDLAAVLTDDQAAQIAEVLANDLWQSRNAKQITLDQSQLELDPSDNIEVPLDGRYQRMRIVNFDDKGQLVRNAALVLDDDGAYISVRTGEVSVYESPSVIVASPVEAFYLDLPALRAEDDDAGFYAVARPVVPSGRFAGGSIYRSSDGNAYAKVATFSAAATMGTIANVLGIGSGDIVDDANLLDVKLTSGTLASITDDELLAGLNAAAVGAHGRWEIIQFKTATPGAIAGSYTLSHLTRGRRGSEHAIGSSLLGDRFVLLTGPGIARVPLSTADISVPKTYKAVGAGNTVELSEAVSFTGNAEALKPFSPVHLSGTRSTATGAWTLTWIRRGRIGQTLGSGEIALSETIEAYTVDILNGTTIVRTINVTGAPSAQYSSADQSLDFDDPISTVTFRVRQVSTIVGAGYPSADTTITDTAVIGAASDFVKDNEDKPVFLTARNGVAWVAKIGSIGGAPVVGIYSYNGVDAPIVTSTTYGYGGIPDAYLYRLNEDGKLAIPLVAHESDGPMAVFWRAQPFPSVDANFNQFLLTSPTDAYGDVLHGTDRLDTIIATERTMGLFRSVANSKTYAWTQPDKIYSSSDDNVTWALDGNVTGALAGGFADKLIPVKLLQFGTPIILLTNSGLYVNAAGDMIDWVDTGLMAALNTAGYGSTLSTSLIDVATHGGSSEIIVVIQSHRDSDDALVNIIARSTDAATWTLVRVVVVTLGDAATGQRWVSITHWDASTNYAIYGYDQFTGIYPQVLISNDSGVTWTKQSLITIMGATGWIVAPQADDAGQVWAIASAGTRSIGGVATVYGAVCKSSDGYNFTAVLTGF